MITLKWQNVNTTYMIRQYQIEITRLENQRQTSDKTYYTTSAYPPTFQIPMERILSGVTYFARVRAWTTKNPYFDEQKGDWSVSQPIGITKGKRSMVSFSLRFTIDIYFQNKDKNIISTLLSILCICIRQIYK